VKVSFTTEEGAGGGRERGPGKETRKDGRQEGSERKGEKRRGRPEQLEDRRQKAPPAVLLASLLPVSSVWCHALIWTQTWAVSWANAHTSFLAVAIVWVVRRAQPHSKQSLCVPAYFIVQQSQWTSPQPSAPSVLRNFRC